MPRVLLIEDDAIHARVVAGWLTSARFHVQVSGSVHDALSLLKQPWDAIVCDCDLPDGSGLEIARIAKLAFPRLPFILVTAGRQAERVVDALRYGVDDMMLKMAPLRREQLVARVMELIEQTRTAGNVVLAIGAHPDDVEIGCGGTLAQHIDQGDRVVILTLSSGEAGGDVTVRRKEAQEAADILGATLVIGDLPDTAMTENGATIEMIRQQIEAHRPTRIYTHSPNDVHQDHRNVARATLVAARGVSQLACYQAPSTTVDFRPSMFTDIAPYLNKKLAMLKTFQSQIAKAAYMAPEQIVANGRYWSRFIKGTAAEPFEVVRACV